MAGGCSTFICFFFYQNAPCFGRRRRCLPSDLSRRSSKSAVGSLECEGGTPEPSIQHTASSIQDSATSIEHPVSSIQHPTPSGQPYKLNKLNKLDKLNELDELANA
jgi:hypothetical protein